MSSPDLHSAMERALREKTADAAWAHLAPFRAQVVEDPDVALAWVTLLAASPSRPNALEDARQIVERFGATDPALAASALTAIIRVDERRPADEPVPDDAPAKLAAELADRLLASIDEAALRDPDRGGALAIARANALRRLGSSRDADAVAAFESAIKTYGARPEWLFDLGLCHKQAGRFVAARVAFEKARALYVEGGGGERRAVLANLAIASIGSGEATLAAEVLRAMGHRVETVEPRPFVPDLSPVQVRVPTRGPGHGLFSGLVPDEAVGFERLWVQPLSPCHGVVRSPTFREAVTDWGDVVLWDLAPTGAIQHEGRKVPVFPLLAVLHPGDERRFRWIAMEQSEGQVRAIGAALPEGVVLFEHGARVERLCARCAAGEVLTRHDHEAPTEHRAVIGKLIVPASVVLRDVQRALEVAIRAQPGVLLAIPSLFEALGDTSVAGKNHKTWGVIERGMAAASR